MNVFLWIVAILGVISGGLCIFMSKVTREVSVGDEGKRRSKSLKVQGLIYSLVGLISIVVTCSFTIVPTGKVGVVYQLGVLQENTGAIGSGTVFWHVPFVQSVKKINIMQENANEASGQSDKVWGESKNKLPIYCRDIRITYQINPNGMMYLLKNVIDMSEIQTWGKSVSSAFSASTIQLSDEDVCKQAMVEPAMLKELQRITDDKYGVTNGESNVVVVRVLIGELDYEQAYQDAITTRKNAEQEAVTVAVKNQVAIDKAAADAEVARINAENAAKVKLIEAQGVAEAKIIEANANANAMTINADAEAYAYKVKSAEITPELLAKWEMDARKEWGWVTVYGGSTIVDQR